MAAITQAELVRRIRQIVAQEPYIGSSSTSMTGSTATIAVADSTVFSVGDVLEWADGDLARVTALASATTLTIERDFGGATGSSHSANATFLVNPQVRYLAITDAIKSTVGTLWPYAWKAKSYTVTPAAGDNWYDLSALAIDLIDATQLTTDSTPRLFGYGTRGRTYPAEIRRGLPTSLATSGTGLYLPFHRNDTNTITVRARAKITADIASSSYTDIDDADSLLINTVIYGSLEQLTLWREVPRELSEDVTMANETVRPGQRIQLSAYWHQKYVEFRNQLHLELMATIPPLPSGRGGTSTIS